MLKLAFLLSFHLTPQTPIDYKQPQLAATDKLVAVTFGSGNSIYYSGSRDLGATFSNPVKVADVGSLMLGKHRGPRVAITADAIVISAVTDPQGNGALLTWRSLDGGRTWSTGGKVNDAPRATREGLHAMAAGPGGRLYAVWLDLRHVVPGKPGTELYGAYSTDNGATWSKNIAVYKSPTGSICQCCHPSLMFDAKGELTVMWRNDIGENRDMYLSRSSDGGLTFGVAEKLGSGTWKINACPMDGGGVTKSAEGKMVTVWRRGTDVYLAPEGGAETLLHAGKDPAIAANREGVFAAWSAPDGVFVRVPGKLEPVTLDHEGGFAQLVAVPNGPVIAAWERKGSIQFHTLP